MCGNHTKDQGFARFELVTSQFDDNRFFEGGIHLGMDARFFILIERDIVWREGKKYDYTYHGCIMGNEEDLPEEFAWVEFTELYHDGCKCPFSNEVISEIYSKAVIQMAELGRYPV